MILLTWRIIISGLCPYRIKSEILILYIRQSIELIELDLGPSKDRNENMNTEEMQTDIHTLNGIRIHDPSVWAGEPILCLTPRGHCDWCGYDY
jgi:hypothetical protein